MTLDSHAHGSTICTTSSWEESEENVMNEKKSLEQPVVHSFSQDELVVPVALTMAVTTS